MNYATRIRRELVLNGYHVNHRTKLCRYLARAMYGKNGKQPDHKRYRLAADSAFADERSVTWQEMEIMLNERNWHRPKIIGEVKP